jgi:hypothetical protein
MKTIHLLHGYRGALTNEQYLQPGMLTLEDDLALYLVDNGHAILAGFDPNIYLMPAEQPAPTIRKQRKDKGAS